MRRDKPVQPHGSLKGIWHCFFGTYWYYDFVTDIQFHDISFVRNPPDPLCRIDPKRIINDTTK